VIRNKKKTKTEQERWLTTLRSRCNTITKLLDEHFVLHGQLSNVICYFETKDSYMQERHIGRTAAIKLKMKEAHAHCMEASRLMREIRQELKDELADRMEEHEKLKRTMTNTSSDT